DVLRCGIVFVIGLFGAMFAPARAQQEFLPAPPPDRTSIYVLDEGNKLVALPFEHATSPLRKDQIAKSTHVSYVELKGEHAATTLSANQRFFLFTYERPGVHPPFIVWLTPHKGARRVTAIAQRGMS